MKTFLKILDVAAYCMLVVFAAIFLLIGFTALFLLVVEGDFMNVFGLIGFVLAWIIWNILR